MERVERGPQLRLRAGAKAELYRHLAVYVFVNLLLVAINILAWHGYFWAVWPLLGWGIGLGVHALRVFVFDGADQKRRRDEAG